MKFEIKCNHCSKIIEDLYKVVLFRNSIKYHLYFCSKKCHEFWDKNR